MILFPCCWSNCQRNDRTRCKLVKAPHASALKQYSLLLVQRLPVQYLCIIKECIKVVQLAALLPKINVSLSQSNDYHFALGSQTEYQMDSHSSFIMVPHYLFFNFEHRNIFGMDPHFHWMEDPLKVNVSRTHEAMRDKFLCKQNCLQNCLNSPIAIREVYALYYAFLILSIILSASNNKILSFKKKESLNSVNETLSHWKKYIFSEDKLFLTFPSIWIFWKRIYFLVFTLSH